METRLDHEKLRVYQASLDFVTWATDLVDTVPAKAVVKDQLDRASTSIPLNLAEGNAKWTGPDRRKFFRNALGSLMECGACLDVFVAKRLCDPARVRDGKSRLVSLASMLMGLERSNEARIAEGSADE